MTWNEIEEIKMKAVSLKQYLNTFRKLQNQKHSFKNEFMLKALQQTKALQITITELQENLIIEIRGEKERIEIVLKKNDCNFYVGLAEGKLYCKITSNRLSFASAGC